MDRSRTDPPALEAPPHVPIFEGEPKNWRELQSLVALLFSGLGCTVDVEKPVVAARGKVSIDVFVADLAAGHKITYLCECKLWGNRVSQHVVHSFRTVVADIGADVGIMISAKGFQRGAVAAAALTNIRLLTWEQFQQTFEDRWTASKIRAVDAHEQRIVESAKKMPGFPNAANGRFEYIRDLIRSEDECLPIVARWQVTRESIRNWPAPGMLPIPGPFGDFRSRYDFFESTLRTMVDVANRCEALVEKWTDHSLIGTELLRGPLLLSYKEAARALALPLYVFGAVAQDLFFVDDGTGFDEETEQYGVADLIRVWRSVSWFVDDTQ